MSLYGDLHVELAMSILDRSYGGLKRSIEVSIFWCATVDLYGGLDNRSCRCGVDTVSMASMVVGCLSIVMSSTLVWSRLWTPLATEGQVQRLYKLGTAYCYYLMLSCPTCRVCIWSLLPSNSVRLNAELFGPLFVLSSRQTSALVLLHCYLVILSD